MVKKPEEIKTNRLEAFRRFYNKSLLWTLQREKKSKEDEQTLAELTSAHRPRSQAKCQLPTTKLH